MAQSRVSAPERPGHRHARRPTSARGTSCSSAGSTTRSWSRARTSTLDLGPHEYNSAKAQGVVVVLPQKTVDAPTLGAPAAGTKQWWSGTGDDYDATLTRQVARARRARPTLSFQARWNIEDCGTDAVRLRLRRGRRRHRLQGDPGLDHQGRRGQRHRRLPAARYTPATFDLSAYAGKTVSLRFRYKTDGAAQGNDADAEPPGIFVDEIKLTNGTHDACSPTAPRTAPTAGRRAASAIVGATSSTRCTTTTTSPPTARTRRTTSTCRPGRTTSASRDRPDWVEHFPYQNGLLVSYWDTSYADNNESQHPGQGEILPIDAQPAADLPPRRQAVARPRSRPTTRRSGWRSRTRSRCTRRRRARASLHPRPGGACRRSTTARVLGPGAADRRREGPARGRDRSACQQQSGTSMRIRIGSAAAGT